MTATPTTTKKRITPEMASKMLERNKENRPLSDRHVAFLASEMRAGRWKFNGDTISFSGDRLIDGQHRLWAVMDSGVAIDAIVVEGLEDDCFITKDIGKRRTSNDMLHNAGYRSAPGLATAAALLWRYLSGSMMTRTAVSNGEILDTIAEHPAIEEIVRRLPKRTIVSKAVLAVFRYLTGKVDNQMSEAFVEKFMTGIGTIKGEAVALLHNYFVQRQRRGHLVFGPQTDLAICIKAWNAMRTGKKIELLIFRTAENYPQVDGLKMLKKKASA